MVREGRVFVSSASRPAFGSNYYVQCCAPGAQVASASSGTTVAVRSGHGFSALDKFIVGTDRTRYRKVLVAGATSLTIDSAVSVSAGDILVNIGPDTGASTPVWDGNGVTIYSDADYSTTITNQQIQCDSTGRYRYWHQGIALWELVRTATDLVSYYTTTGSQTDGPTSSTDNAIARFDGTGGRLLQNSSATINDGGVVSAAGFVASSNIQSSDYIVATGLIQGGSFKALTTGKFNFRDDDLYLQSPSDGELDIVADVAIGMAAGTSIELSAPTIRLLGATVRGASTTFADADATPSVAGHTFFKTANTGATTITNLDDGAAGQEIVIQIGDANTDFQHSAAMKLAGAANWTTSAANDTIRFIFDGSVWYELSRSDNS